MVVSHSARVTQVRAGGDHSRMTDSTWVSSSEGLSPDSSTPTAFPTLSPLAHISLLPIELVRFQCFLIGLCFVFGPMDTFINYYCKCCHFGLGGGLFEQYNKKGTFEVWFDLEMA